MIRLKHVLLSATLILGGSLHAQDILKQEFHENGLLSMSVYKVQSQVHFISYHENGKVKEMGSYRNGVREGTWKSFDENGQLVAKGRFLDDRRVGPWSFRFEYGGGYGKLDYDSGRLLSGKRWNSDRELISSID